MALESTLPFQSPSLASSAYEAEAFEKYAFLGCRTSYSTYIHLVENWELRGILPFQLVQSLFVPVCIGSTSARV